jgi:hypothetical protein
MAKHYEHHDPIIQTQQNPFCSIDPSCPCHDDPELIAEITQKVEQGLLTPEEATRL